MQYKAIPILLKHASLFRRPKWKTDPNWKDDKAAVEEWYDDAGWRNNYASNDSSRMQPEEFYALLNKYGIDYDDADDDEISMLRRKHIKQILDLLKKKQKSGVGPEAYKYWMHKSPVHAAYEIEQALQGYRDNDLGNNIPPAIFDTDAPYEDLMKLRDKQYAREDKLIEDYWKAKGQVPPVY